VAVEDQPTRPTGLRVRVERIALVCAMSLTTINIWTGGPLFALWVGSRVQDKQRARDLSPLEVILIVSVVAGVVAFEIWFFVFSGSSIDQRSGRGWTRVDA
jgi:phosphoglycerol transferase MdoB-like AlkP superfamily enzyme